MKQTPLIILAAITTICLLVFACRKEIDYLIHDRDRVTPDLLESAQVWYLQRLSSDPSIPRLLPTWKDAWGIQSVNGDSLVIVPAPENYIGVKDISVRRFFVFKTDGVSVSDGRIVEFVGESFDVSSQVDLLLKHFRSDVVPGFTGIVLDYDVNYDLFDKKSYTGGQLDNRDVGLVNLSGYEMHILAKSKWTRRAPIQSMSREVISAAIPCPPYTETYNGVPGNLAGNCVITFLVYTTLSSNGCIASKTYNYLSHTCPVPEGSGSGSPASGSGSSGSGDGPPYGGGAYSNTITNNIKDPCINNTISNAINSPNLALELIDDIIKELDSDLAVDIQVEDGETNGNYPGEMQDAEITKVNGIPRKFSAKLVLDSSYVVDASQEGTVAIFIHEVLHSYIAKAGLIDGTNNIDHHQTMAEKYVAPMASYLQGLFGISEFDAYALSWAGLTYTSAFSDVLTFEIGGETYDKSDLLIASAAYMGRGGDGNLLNGTEHCSN